MTDGTPKMSSCKRKLITTETVASDEPGTEEERNAAFIKGEVAILEKEEKVYAALVKRRLIVDSKFLCAACTKDDGSPHSCTLSAANQFVVSKDKYLKEVKKQDSFWAKGKTEMEQWAITSPECSKKNVWSLMENTNNYEDYIKLKIVPRLDRWLTKAYPEKEMDLKV